MMTAKKQFKLYKQKKHWVIGCSTLLLSLTLGAVDVQAADNSTTEKTDDAQLATANSPETSTAVPLRSTGTTEPQGQTNANPVTSQATPSAVPQQAANNTTQATAPVTPVASSTGPSSSDSPANWDYNYERIINITYQDHYDTNGGASSNYHCEKIIQMAENGRWEEVNWYPPKGTFPPGVKVPPVHFAAASPTEAANQRWEVSYVMRSIDLQTATGHQIISQVYAIHNGQTIDIPEMEIQDSGIPVAYHPRISPLGIQNDKVIERGGYYYLTGATLTYNTAGIIYHGANLSTAANIVSFSELVIFSAPINLVYQDLSGKVYNAYGDQYPAYAASYQNVAQVDYGQTLSVNQLYADAHKYLNRYVTSVFDDPDSNYQIYGYFDPAGKLHPIQSPADYPGFTDAQASSDGLTYQLAIIYRRYGKVDAPVTKTRTIIVNMPDGRQEQTIQEVTLAQFADYDGITGEELGTPTWKVLTGNEPDSNDDWETLTAGNHNWQTFIVPSIAGYTPNLTQVGAKTVTDSSQDQTINIYYTANAEPISPAQPDQGESGHSGSANAAGQGDTKSVNVAGQTVSKSSNQQGTTARLPQTGDQSSAGLVALGGLTLLTLFGLAGRQKRAPRK